MHATISNIHEGTIAEDIGLKKGDILVSLNNNAISDVIDYMYYFRDHNIKIEILRDKKPHTFKIQNRSNKPLGIELKSFRTRTCRNKCIFCFVNQLPKGMRKPLYLKDDDYRMSFLFGNYITLTNLSEKEKKRIIEQKLSPLYISVHSTNNNIRRKMLGNPKASDIMKDLQDLIDHKIRLHVQIVVCPGFNDGEELANTIKDLQRYYPYVSSIAAVPVGLTKFKKGNLRPVEKEDAIKVIETVKKFRRAGKRRHGDPVVHLADEFYLKAGLPFPALKEYGDLPQIENGVGLVPVFLHCSKKVKIPKKIESTKAAVITGASFMPFIQEFAQKLNTIEGLDLEVFKVENNFFGSTVTVAGLITGKDILKTLVGKTKADCLLVPNVMLRDGSDMFLDNVSLKEVGESLGMNVTIIEPTPDGLVRGITDACKRKD
jgi:putative radical SAM enzyme (TIGR03279 family)